MHLSLRFLAAIASLSGALAQPVCAQVGAVPIYVAIYIEVAAGSVNDGVAILRRYHNASMAEAGNLRSDVGQEIGRANRFVVLQIWKDRAAFDAHENSAGTAAFHDELKTVQIAPNDQRLHNPVTIGSSKSTDTKGAIYVVSHVDVPAARKDEAILALNPLAEASRKGAGNLRFDVWQQSSRPNHFTVVEIWNDRAAYDARGSATPQRQFREKLAPMLGALYDERVYRTID